MPRLCVMFTSSSAQKGQTRRGFAPRRAIGQMTIAWREAKPIAQHLLEQAMRGDHVTAVGCEGQTRNTFTLIGIE